MGKWESGCPRHGNKFLHTDGHGAIYCLAPTPGELSSKCFYHPTKNGKEKIEEFVDGESEGNPDVMARIFSEFEHSKELKEKRKANTRKYVRTKIQSSAEHKKFFGNFRDGLPANSGLYLE